MSKTPFRNYCINYCRQLNNSASTPLCSFEGALDKLKDDIFNIGLKQEKILLAVHRTENGYTQGRIGCYPESTVDALKQLDMYTSPNPVQWHH